MNQNQDKNLKNVINTLVIENMHLDKEFINEMEKVASGNKTTEQLRAEVIKKYAR